MLTMLGATAAGTASLKSGDVVALLALVIGGSLLAGVIVAVTRHKQRKGPAEEAQSVVRSWLTVTLVLALVTGCMAAFEIDDSQLRNTLFGGLVASAGAATAFYFASKGADGARADILKTTTALARGPGAPTIFTALSPPAAGKGGEYSYSFVADGVQPMTYTLGSGALRRTCRLTIVDSSTEYPGPTRRKQRSR